MRGVMLRVVRYATKLDSAANMVRYVAWRSEDVRGRTPEIFNDRTDTADVRSFIHGLEDQVTRHPRAAKAYHAVFSLSRDAYDRGQANYQEIVRDVIRAYELETGRRLTWLATVHHNPTHPHVHVIMKATYQDRNGRTRKLRLDRREVHRIKEINRRTLEARGIPLERSVRSREELTETRQNARLTGGILSVIQQQIKLAQVRASREQHMMEREWRRRADPDRER